jgi:hypothetical protein
LRNGGTLFDTPVASSLGLFAGIDSPPAIQKNGKS